MRSALFLLLVSGAHLTCATPGNAPLNPGAQVEFSTFLRAFEGKLVPLVREANMASYQANVSGKEVDYKHSDELQLALKTLYSDPATFAKLKAWQASGAVKDPILKRQMELLYLAFLGNQLPKELLGDLVTRGTALEKTFNTFRATLDGKTVSDNDLNAVLSDSKDSAQLEQAWMASKVIGQKVAPAIVELVKLRNKAARALGYANFQVMQLALGEQDPGQLEKLFDQLDELTRKDYAQAKNEVDTFLAARLGIAKGDLRPWHYQDPFFQGAPKIYAVDLDVYYKGKDLAKLAEHYYAGLGMPIADVLDRSDLYEKPGKYQHAFSSDIDHSGDVRILCSLKSNAYWMDTILHESGHSVYSKFNDPKLPWLLRDSAHAFTTEAIANLFGRFASNPVWLHEVLGLSAEESARIAKPLADSLRLEQLVFSRWSQVMFRFEKAMYENPDQDLNKLWWDLVERFQLIRRPGGHNGADWASKIHVALYPAYYHNYLLGQLLASQIYHHVGTRVMKAKDPQHVSFAGHKEVGAYLIESVFKPGMRYPWNEMIRRATGEELTPKYYAEQFIH